MVPLLKQSNLGYLLSGPLPYPVHQSTSSISLQITSLATKPAEPQFWSVEGIGTNVPDEETDSTFLQAYQNTCVSHTPEGMSFQERKTDPIYLQTLAPAPEEHVL